MEKTKRWWIGPASLAMVACAAALAPLLMPSGYEALGTLQLTLGSLSSAEFKVGYEGRYSIGVEMDKAVAARLIPCAVRPGAFTSDANRCPSYLKPPLELAFTLRESGLDISWAIEPSKAVSGGRYSEKTYTWEAGYVQLRPRTKYRLSVRMLADGTVLKSAQPKLVIIDDEPASGDQRALVALAASLIAACATLASVVWGLIALGGKRD